MTTVYVVFHSDIEDDKYVRAVCSTQERAEAIANSPEPCRMPHAHTRRYPSVIHNELTDALNCYGARDHFTRGGTTSLCCHAEAWVLDAVEPVVVLDHAATASPAHSVMAPAALTAPPER